jgi:putative membrane protein
VSYLLDHWSAGPCLLAVLALAAWHEAGLALLARRSGPARARQRRLRSFWFYGGLAVLVIAVESPIGYWSRDYFYVHMIQHLLLMFAAPSLIVAGAPWQPLLAVLPRAGRAAAGPGPAPQSPGTGRPGPVRALAGAVARPWLAIALFNAVMVAWHFPVLLDASERSEPVRWLMYGCFLLAGVLFWAQFISSPPLRMRMTPAAQAAALLITNVVMWILAMAMGIFSSAPWYSVYSHIPGITLLPMADQQIGAGILWVCGDFWAVPCMIIVIRRLISEDGGIGPAIEKIIGRDSRHYQWANRS